MSTREPPPARSFTDCGSDLTKYRTERWLSDLSRKAWVYLQRLKSATVSDSEDGAWLEHEVNQATCRLRTIEWLRTVNYQRRGE